MRIPVENHTTYCNLHGRVGIQREREKEKKQLSCPRLALFIFHSTSAKFDSTSDISFHENNNNHNNNNKKKQPQTRSRDCGICRGWSWGRRVGALSIKGKQAGWRQLGFSIQFSCPEPWKTG